MSCHDIGRGMNFVAIRTPMLGIKDNKDIKCTEKIWVAC